MGAVRQPEAAEAEAAEAEVTTAANPQRQDSLSKVRAGITMSSFLETRALQYWYMRTASMQALAGTTLKKVFGIWTGCSQ